MYLNCNVVLYFLADNNDFNFLKLINVYIKLIQDGLIEMNHLLSLLQFAKKVGTVIHYVINGFF